MKKFNQARVNGGSNYDSLEQFEIPCVTMNELVVLDFNVFETLVTLERDRRAEKAMSSSLCLIRVTKSGRIKQRQHIWLQENLPLGASNI